MSPRAIRNPSWLHETVLLGPLGDALAGVGDRVRRGVSVTTPRGLGFVDLVADRRIGLLAVEAECEPRRAAWDVVKAEALGAGELWIVVATAGMRTRVEAALARAAVPASVRVCVFTLGQALQRVAGA